MIHSDVVLPNVAFHSNMICSAMSCDMSLMADDPDLETPHGRLAWARARAGYGDKAEFAKAAGVNPTTYRAYENGQNGFAKLTGKFAKLLGVTAEWLLSGGAAPTAAVPAKPPAYTGRPTDFPSTRSADGGEAVAIVRMDLSYAMGPGTNLDDSYVEGEPVVFDLSFLRGLTRAEPSMLRIVDGVGDSMFPTILDRELLIIDLSQRVLNMQDRIWAISLYGAGALKRLRTIGKGKVLVISDNPDVPDQEVDADDITIAGRLVGSIKRH